MALRGNAAFIVTTTAGQEYVYRLNDPMRIVSTRVVQRRYTEESLDRTTRNVVTVGDPVYETTGRVRFANRPQDLMMILHHAANGASIRYVHDLASGEPGYPATLIADGDAVELTPDPDRFGYAEYDTTVVLRSATPWMPYLDARGVLLRLHAGSPF